MRVVIVITLLTSFMISLTGCEKEHNVSGIGSTVNHNDIIKGFIFTSQPPLPALKIVDADHKIPRYTLQARLSHTDPLDLPLGNIVISGSDTLWPVTRQIATEFYNDGYIGTILLSQSKTIHGMQAMCKGEGIDIVNASHAIRSSEQDVCDKYGITPVYVKVGYDPLVLIAHESNTWLNNIQYNRLKELFASTNWSQFNPDFPDKPIELYVPRKNDGAMAVMTESIYGDAKVSTLRNLKNAHYYPFNLELTRDLAENPTGLGFVSFGKLLKLKRSHMKVIPIDEVKPNDPGNNYPIKRALYIVTHTKAIQKPEVQTFIAYYLNYVHKAMPALGFIPLEGRDAKNEQRKLVEILEKIMPEGNSVSFSKTEKEGSDL